MAENTHPEPGASTSYSAQGSALEHEAVEGGTYPIADGQPPSDDEAVASNPVSAAQAAYQAAYGAPSCATTTPQAATPATPGAPVTPPRTTAPKKAHTELDPERVFLICGMVVGCVIVVFGLCMLAFYTPAEVSEFFDGYRMNGSAGWSDTGATAQQILKAGFSMLLIGLGATDICAFGAKLMKARKQRK